MMTVYEIIVIVVSLCDSDHQCCKRSHAFSLILAISMFYTFAEILLPVY